MNAAFEKKVYERSMSVAEVQSWMRFLGWSNDGKPGSFKRDADMNVIARHGDATWDKDVEHSLKQIAGRRELDRVERVNRFRQSLGHSIYSQ